MAQQLTNPMRNHEDAGLIPGLGAVGEGSGIAVSCGVGGRRGWDVTLLWLRCRLAAVALILPLAWELPYVANVALKSKKKKKKKKKKLGDLGPSLDPGKFPDLSGIMFLWIRCLKVQ